MFDKTLKKLQHNIYDATCTIETKIDNYKEIINSLMNKQEMLLKAINEDRLVITKILEHLEKIEGEGPLTGGMGSVKRKKR